MIQLGDIYRADLNEEVRRRVLVVSTERFHKNSGRALVATEVTVLAQQATFPWRVDVDGAVFAIDLVNSVSLDRLLERIDRAPAQSMQRVRRALLAIT